MDAPANRSPGPADRRRRRGSWRGGLVTGEGSTVSDDIPMMLSNREYVVRASAVERIGVPTLNAINAGQDLNLTPAGAGSDPRLVSRIEQLSSAIRDMQVTNVSGNTIVAPNPEAVPGELTRQARRQRWLN